MPRTSPGSATTTRPAQPRRRLDAVLFDFHGTLAQVEEPVTWVLAAAAECGVTLERPRATVLADRLLTAGRAGGPLPARVPPHLAEVWADRDLYEHAHRAAFTGLAASVDAGVDGLADALYERLLRPEGWLPYTDTAATLESLRAAGLRVAVVSNIGFDIRPLFAAWGLTALVDAFVLSYEVGRCKPDPAIFLRACGLLGVDPERALMVGDTPADAGAVRAGCAALVLPAADAGRANGLAAVLHLAGADEA
ncbi:HAD-IA family hydrolase [Micromonospora sp. NPDC049679]|uniref:HAD family hydrolase n=1 Tax=Micromonospora sp. NPDC049679 TaxID=3155920 RepID=UPI0033C92D66